MQGGVRGDGALVQNSGGRLRARSSLWVGFSRDRSNSIAKNVIAQGPTWGLSLKV